MSQDRVDIWLGAFLAIFGLTWTGIVIATIPAMDQPGGPQIFPLLLGGILTALGLYLLGSAARRLRRADATGERIERPSRHEAIVTGGVFGILLLYGFLMEKIGFLLATPIVILAAFALCPRPVPWRLQLILAIGITVACYLIFQVLLEAHLPRGTWIRLV